VSFHEGIARTVAWYGEHRGDPALAPGGSTSPGA
jgi:hypothetical protein